MKALDALDRRYGADTVVAMAEIVWRTRLGTTGPVIRLKCLLPAWASLSLHSGHGNIGELAA